MKVGQIAVGALTGWVGTRDWALVYYSRWASGSPLQGLYRAVAGELGHRSRLRRAPPQGL